MREITNITEAKDAIRNSLHHTCRVKTNLWREILLKNQDTVTINATVWLIVGKSLGAGVYKLKAIQKRGAISKNG